MSVAYKQASSLLQLPVFQRVPEHIPERLFYKWGVCIGWKEVPPYLSPHPTAVLAVKGKQEVLRTAVGIEAVTWGFKTPPNSSAHTSLGLVQENSCAVRVSVCCCDALQWRRHNIRPDEAPTIIRRQTIMTKGHGQEWRVGIQLLGISLTIVHNGLIKIG